MRAAFEQERGGDSDAGIQKFSELRLPANREILGLFFGNPEYENQRRDGFRDSQGKKEKKKVTERLGGAPELDKIPGSGQSKWVLELMGRSRRNHRLKGLPTARGLKKATKN